MKQGIHPEYTDTKIRCLCGSEIHTRSTANKEELQVEICSSCHPFFTGQQKIIDTAGRVERFKQRYKDANYAKKN
jgi:large subunit ribosomal protein L31